MALAREKHFAYVIAAVAMLHTASALLHGSTGACRTRPRAAADAELFMGSGAAVAPSELPSAARRGRDARASQATSAACRRTRWPTSATASSSSSGARGLSGRP